LENWHQTAHAFQHNHWQNIGNKFKYKSKGKELNDSFQIVEEVNKYLKEKSWAEAITWRIEREHQLRLLDESKTKNYRKIIEELMPYDGQEAEKWRNWLVVQELEKRYFSKHELSELVHEINQKTALASFDFSEVHPYEFIKYIKKTENTNAYWHLRATLDLNPNDDVFKSNNKKIELEKNQKISFEKLAQQLKSGLVEVNKPFDFFYYDRYIKNNIQQKKSYDFHPCDSSYSVLCNYRN
jgi:hypothetical protein